MDKKCSCAVPLIAANNVVHAALDLAHTLFGPKLHFLVSCREAVLMADAESSCVVMADAKAPCSEGIHEKTRAKRSPNGTKRARPAKAADNNFYEGVSRSIGCPNITTETVQKVCEGLRKAVIRDVQAHGQFKLYGMAMFKLTHRKGRPAHVRKVFGAEKTIPAKPPHKRVFARALKQLKCILSE